MSDEPESPLPKSLWARLAIVYAPAVVILLEIVKALVEKR